ncbi:hypothetical protein A2996_01210 [Candidatus Campbellbacteria bacterium RIFCSPLOWO2_01_FULL_34_15]|uniref:UDP-N-acetylmuramate--L-alanine ligase n=2 Tax=Candidatus Campbelliibacteriota TaxID=1752727 RepID=A0A1F5EP68_9BACT|nr:MAG: hypothetical protein A2811_02760 [Candidatus Campbellbacteria bacterium RIFCSPHIGHO2_01_FULL_34_10]OGD69165.1 MAG: hypothetical protein A2996_01210 [Candidatus Campbellbacteria bacterium RIFCSPLOWO2_01_FULL_34_15]
MKFKNARKIHFIGIGGIGVSAMARMALKEGKKVTGSNLAESEITSELKKLGAVIKFHHDGENIEYGTDLVIFSPAVPKDNPELLKAKKIGIPAISYPRSLGDVSENKYTIAVSGTHGKTTTTAMLADVLRDSYFDPTVVVGSLLKKEKTNFIHGNSKYFVTEACEYKRSFLELKPNILVITNIDLDHLDYFKNIFDIQKAFKELIAKMDEKDYIVCDPNDKRVAPALVKAVSKVVDYTTQGAIGLNLKIPGEHNIKNAFACLAVANILGINHSDAIKSLNNFEGTWRRFELKGKTKKGALIYDDYAHNPTEVQVTLKGAREFFKDKKITVIFQPHLYSRTKIFLEDFAKSFNDVDRVIVLPIYAAREEEDKEINSKILASKIKKNNRETYYIEYEKMLNEFNSDIFGQEDVILTMGAGDVYKIGEKILGNNKK